MVNLEKPRSSQLRGFFLVMLLALPKLGKLVQGCNFYFRSFSTVLGSILTDK